MKQLWQATPEGGDRGLKALAGLKDKRGFIDKDRLDLSERKAVEYWTKGATRDQVTSVHREAGLMIKDIPAELAGSPEESNAATGHPFSETRGKLPFAVRGTVLA